MRLVLPEPEDVSIEVRPIEPLPLHVARWRDRHVLGTAPIGSVKVRAVRDGELEAGWPLTIVDSDLLDERGAVVERRLHALYRFAGHGCAAVARASDLGRAEEALRAAAVDFDDGTISALSQVWDGVSPPSSTAPAPAGGERRLRELLRGWRRHIIAEGLVLGAPGDAEGAAVQIFEMRRPLRRLRDIVAATVAGMAPPLQATAQVGALERFVTAEGEHGALVAITGEPAPGARVVRTLAIVLADDWYVLVDGIVARPEMEAPTATLVREIARHYFLGLGEARRRPCDYDLPEGWAPVRRAHATTFHRPRSNAVLAVFDARPATASVPDAHDRVLFVESPNLADTVATDPALHVSSRHGLSGARRTVTGVDHAGRPLTVHRITMTDGRYIYVAQLEAPTVEMPACLESFLATASSIRPVPRPVHIDDSSVTHWVE